MLRSPNLKLNETELIFIIIYGCAYVSTSDQDLTLQRQILRAVGLKLFAQKKRVEAAGKAFLDMLAVFAVFETNLRRERIRLPVRQ